jgi:hypothetical protein
VVANNISMKYEEEGSLFSLSFIVVDWLNVVHYEWFKDSNKCKMNLMNLLDTIGKIRRYAIKATCI